ncbi:MAG: phenylalanyl-tRNA synthetase alpha chain [Candidatus Midichloriaceae bacterium]|jgi:phenylalanyl-tRNA synthetase alpha chain
MIDTNLIYKEFSSLISLIDNERGLEDIRVKFLGKNGVVTIEAKKISSIPNEEKKEFGKKINIVKQEISQKIDEMKSIFVAESLNKKLKEEAIDVTLPGRLESRGKLHPISHSIKIIKDFFHSIEFDHVDGPEIDNEWNNFSALNIPENHPARQMHDTFYVEEDKLLLRTHTSTVQIRHMLNNKPPFKIFSVGKVFRADYDATHTPMFHQLECLVIDKKSNLQDLKYYLQKFLRAFFNIEDLPMRFRASYFPFTEPSFEVDIRCDRSKKNNIKLGVGDDWLEILGCGMVNGKVLSNVGVDPNVYQGFAFGVGIERLAMLKYNIPDLRSFFESDSRWLKHYGF